jgi:sugar fermentation stimulation protein A
VKNTTMKKDHMAQFPDAVSERGQKHLVDLMKVKAQGFDAMLIFIVQRQDCLSFKASDIDLKYKELLGKAKDNGVLIRAICAQINERGLNLTHEIPCLF